MATSQPTTDTSSIVSTDYDGQTLTACERRAVTAVVRAQDDTYDNNEDITTADVTVFKQNAGYLKVRFDADVVVGDKVTKRNLPDGWGFDRMIAHGTGRTGVHIRHENR